MRDRADTGAIAMFGAVIEDRSQQIVILFHNYLHLQIRSYHT
jgi:hypothetical protein